MHRKCRNQYCINKDNRRVTEGVDFPFCGFLMKVPMLGMAEIVLTDGRAQTIKN